MWLRPKEVSNQCPLISVDGNTDHYAILPSLLGIIWVKLSIPEYCHGTHELTKLILIFHGSVGPWDQCIMMKHVQWWISFQICIICFRHFVVQFNLPAKGKGSHHIFRVGQFQLAGVCKFDIQMILILLILKFAFIVLEWNPCHWNECSENVLGNVYFCAV